MGIKIMDNGGGGGQEIRIMDHVGVQIRILVYDTSWVGQQWIKVKYRCRDWPVLLTVLNTTDPMCHISQSLGGGGYFDSQHNI